MTEPPSKIYAIKPQENVHWELTHIRYKNFPELQDAIGHMFYKLTDDQRNNLLKKYNRNNISEIIHLLSEHILITVEEELLILTS